MARFNTIVSAIIATNILWVAVARLTSLRRLAAAQADTEAMAHPEPQPAGARPATFVPQQYVLKLPPDTLPSTPTPRSSRVVIVTAMHKQPCSRTLVGNYLEMLSLKNKENYARAHGFDLQWFTNDVQPGYGGSWNKIQAVLNVMSRTPPSTAEWLLWVDSDAQFLNLGAEIPFASYQDKDCIIWGGNDDALDGNPRGFNAGIMLFRNTNWTRTFLQAIVEYGSEKYIAGRRFETTLRRDLGEGYTKGLKDQIAIAHYLKQHPEARSKVMCADHHLHRMWSWDWKVDDLEREAAPLLVHWPGCGFCKPVDGALDQRACVKSFLEVYGLADQTFTSVLKTGAPFDMDSIDAVLQKVW